jgi:hypothetical protein
VQREQSSRPNFGKRLVQQRRLPIWTADLVRTINVAGVAKLGEPNLGPVAVGLHGVENRT